ncbi:hypothetical protein P8452_03395 [Trifolium repens]|nr:hypothetical protein P8452_03395 [Trifolium repens]
MFASESLPSLPTSFATLDSFCSSTATAAAHENLAKFLGPDLNQPGPSEMPSPTNKSKMETDMAKMSKMLIQDHDFLSISLIKPCMCKLKFQPSPYFVEKLSW